MLAGGIANKGMKNVSEKKMRTAEKGGGVRGLGGGGDSEEVVVVRKRQCYASLHCIQLA